MLQIPIASRNPLVLLRGALERGHGIREEKVERKQEAQLLQRQTRARALGRKMAAVQKLLQVAVQMTAQFIRSLRNGMLSGMRWVSALELLRASTKACL